MVFRWLFSSRSEPEPQPSTDDTSTDEHALGPGDSNPAAVEDLSRPMRVPLTSIAPYLVHEHPELKLSAYDLSRGQYARNVLALTHNAVRTEMADMWADILTSLEQRLTSPAATALNQEDADDIRQWWSGFARFALTSSLVDDIVSKKAFGDVYVGFDKESKEIEKIYHKVQERNNVYLEMAFRKMAKAVDNFESDISETGYSQLFKAWQMLATMLGEIFAESELLIETIDRWMRNPLEYKDLEKQAAKIFTSKKRWGVDDSKRGEMIIMLCRWLGSEDLMREWMYRNLTKKELRLMDSWMVDYRTGRLPIIDRLHQKKLGSETGGHAQLHADPIP